MEYLQILVDWFKETIWPLIQENFTTLFDLVKDLFSDLDLSSVVPE